MPMAAQQEQDPIQRLREEMMQLPGLAMRMKAMEMLVKLPDLSAAEPVHRVVLVDDI